MSSAEPPVTFRQRFAKTGVALLCVLATHALLACIVACLRRLIYPYQIEWCEGAVVDTVRRLLDGKPIYAPPSVEYTCYQYAPFYYWLSGVACRAFGVGFLPLRLVSFLAFLGTLVCVFACATRETRRWTWGLIAAALYASTFAMLAGWFVLARVDSLFVFLFFAAIAVLRCGPDSHPYARASLAAVLLFLSAMTKQTALIMAAPLMLCLCLSSLREGALFTGVTLVLIAGATAILSYLTHGWYTYYTVDMLRQHPWLPDMWVGFWTRDILRPLPIALVLGFAGLAVNARSNNKRDFFWPSLTLGVFAGCWASRIHQGSAINCSMPAYALLPILFAVGAHALFTRATPLRPLAAIPALAALTALGIVQFSALTYLPSEVNPSQAQRDSDRKLLQLVRDLDGEVFFPCYGNLAALAGKTSYANSVSTWDVMRGTNEPLKDALNHDLRQAFDQGRFSVIILDGELAHLYTPLIGPNYTKLPGHVFDAERLLGPNDVYCRADMTNNLELLRKTLPIH